MRNIFILSLILAAYFGSIPVAVAKEAKKIEKKAKKKEKKSANALFKKPVAKLVLGVVQGLKGFGGTVIAIGGDYLSPIGKQQTAEGGFLVYRASEESSSATVTLSSIAFDGGAGYHHPINRYSTVDVGARLGYAQVKIEVESDFLNESASFSENSLFLGVGGGFTYFDGKIGYGAEFRIPLIFFNSELKEYDPKFLLLSVGIKF
jgi:hypothetical protein